MILFFSKIVKKDIIWPGRGGGGPFRTPMKPEGVTEVDLY